MLRNFGLIPDSPIRIKSIGLPLILAFLLLGSVETASAQDDMLDPMQVLQRSAGAPADQMSDGAFRYSIPIDVPEFRGLEPKISLNYNSSQKATGRAESWLGVGWSLGGISSIDREKIGGGVVTYDDSLDLYNLDGQILLACDSGQPNPYLSTYPQDYITSRTSASCASGGNMAAFKENYNKILISAVPTSSMATKEFTVTRPDGVKYRYQSLGVLAGDDESGMDSNYHQVFNRKFLLTEVSDTQSTPNTVKYTYEFADAVDGRAHRLTKVEYEAYQIRFHYEQADMPISTFSVGYQYGQWNTLFGRQHHYLSAIEVLAGNQKILAYGLEYETSPMVGLLRLSKLQKFGSDYLIGNGLVTAGTSLPPHVFKYKSDKPKFNILPSGHNFHTSNAVIDIDNDGLDEAVFFHYINRKTVTGSPSAGYNLVLLRKYLKFDFEQNVIDETASVTGQAFPINHNITTINYSASNSSSGNFLGVAKEFEEVDGEGVFRAVNAHALRVATSGTNPSNLHVKIHSADMTTGQQVTMLDNIDDAPTIGSGCHSPAGHSLLGNFDSDPGLEIVTRVGLYDIYQLPGDRVFQKGSGIWGSCDRDSNDEGGPNVYVFDMDGDGIDEVLDYHWYYRVSQNGLGFAGNYLTNRPIVKGPGFYENSPSVERNVVFGDVNGDGIPDAIYHRRYDYYGKLFVQLGTGSSFLPMVEWIDQSLVKGNNNNHTVYARNTAADVNGDGLVDIIVHNGYDSQSLFPTNERTSLFGFVYLSTGNGFVPFYKSNDPDTQFHINSYNGLGDFDGDGDLDILSGSRDRSNEIYWNNSEIPNILDEVEDPLGKITSVIYEPSTQHDNYRGPGVKQVVSQIETTDDFGQSRTTNYRYSGGWFNYKFRRSMGFEKVTVIHPVDPATGDQPVSVTEFNQSLASSGRPLVKRFYDGETLLREAIHTMDETQLSEGLPLISSIASIENQRIENSETIITRTEYEYDDCNPSRPLRQTSLFC